ncbi:hypothetical protein BDR26DRAFT_855019 [Obelidium mucronatum]|nr:hypothetical protein BDR26DRAFT_855019 [Obelidium mucronatum]
MIQSRLYASLGIMNFSIKKSKPLEDSAIFRLVAPYLDGEGLQRDGKINVHLGVVSPESWSIRDPAVNFECVGGTLEECINSLKYQERPGVSQSLSTRQELPAEFDFYAIFEVATERNHYSRKIKELEHQLQYILARYYLRGSKDFPPQSVTDIGDSIERKKAYTEFVSLEILKLVAFCGLASPVQLDSHYAAELVDTNYPCVSAMMKANRMLCFKVAGINERLDRIEKLLEDLAVETIKLRK